MKAAKTKSGIKNKARLARKKIEGLSPYSKPALRSEAFARALTDAKSCIDDRDRLEALFSEASRKAATVPRDSFKEYWPYLHTMLRLVRAHHRGEYDHAAPDSLLWIIAALNYLIDPFDLIPDKTPFLGFVDDAAVVEFVVDRTRPMLDEFMTWETNGGR
jgi:uncharacterized membrane protein YkvA (DUF1232 family)